MSSVYTSPLEAELAQLSPKELRERAAAEGIDHQQIENARDADPPKPALIALILANSAGLESELARLSSGTCSPCDAGRYQSSSSPHLETDCIRCSAGRYRSSTGGTNSNACTLCPAGQFGRSNRTGCVSCASGQISSAGSDSSSDCAVPTCSPCSGTWRRGSLGDSCDTVCNRLGTTCAGDGSWGVESSADMRTALSAAGADPNAVCSSGFGSVAGSVHLVSLAPYIHNNACYDSPWFERSTCSEMDANARRLCLCTDQCPGTRDD